MQLQQPAWSTSRHHIGRCRPNWAAEERLRETLNASTSQFRQEFSRELLRICSGLQLDPAAPPSQIENSVLSRYGDWLSRAAHRNLVAGVYLWRIDGAAARATRLQATGPKRGGQME